MSEVISIKGCKVHNLKNIDLDIPRNKLVVITGVSGSGKSSLAFDTIYSEAQRRYIETFSVYARQFIGDLKRPDVEKIDGLSPVVAIEQKTTSNNPRSTVGTITEIYDFLRLLFARVSDAYSYSTGKKMITYNNEEMFSLVKKNFLGKKISIFSPVVKSRKGNYSELFQNLKKQGFTKVRVDSEVKEIQDDIKLDRYKIHNIEILIDKLNISHNENSLSRLEESISTALYNGKNSMLILCEENSHYFSKNLICPDTGISYEKPEPNTFSFNSPSGMCKKCNGLGKVYSLDLELLIPDKSKSIFNGGIIPIGPYKNNWIFKQITNISNKYNFELKDPISKIPEKAMNIILYGGKESFKVLSKSLGLTREYLIDFEGLVNFIENQFFNVESKKIKLWAKKFMINNDCQQCNGSRLKKESQFFKIDKKSISEVNKMDINELKCWISSLELKLDTKKNKIAKEIIKEISKRIDFIIDVGLDYLNLNRQTKSLSGGESQRIRLATQIGSQLQDVLYILDEPSIGLHQVDNYKLINSLKKLRDLGNSIIVVEHDKEIMLQSDYIIDVGPSAGKNGGKIVFKGNYKDIIKSKTITADYLNMIKKTPKSLYRKIGEKSIQLKGCSGNNLKNITLNIPLERIIGVCGVSGSGKSSLINRTLYPILNNHFFNGTKEVLEHKKINGIENIDKVIQINQSPIGRTTRSNPATYTGLYNEIRNLYSKLPESSIRGYKAGRFSFNVKGGRCEDCSGGGMKKIEMNFLPDVYIECDSCNGKRFNKETLSVKFKGHSISDILNMTIKDAAELFTNYPKIIRKLKYLNKVGLGYITLGQQSTTLSGGESQRIKLATELSKKDTGKTLYIFDEPTTGLHFNDIKVFLDIIFQLSIKGNSIIIIEHNLDVLKICDYIIELGPKGGKNGGNIIFQGSLEEITRNKKTVTGKFIKKELNLQYGI